MDNSFNNAEQKIINGTAQAIQKTLLELEPKFIEVDNARLHNNTVEARHGASSQNASNEQSNSKTRVREMKNAPRVINNTAPVQQPTQTTSDKYRYVSSEESTHVGGQNNPFDPLRSGGNATASTILIVIASFVIVAMLIVICLTVLNSFGMLPF